MARERRNGRAHASGGTTQGAEVVRGYEWVGARVGTGMAFSNLALCARSWSKRWTQQITMSGPCNGRAFVVAFIGSKLRDTTLRRTLVGPRPCPLCIY
eukprot:scaffold76096_cov65-Phaeocystis_antarctica.AAC.2